MSASWHVHHLQQQHTHRSAQALSSGAYHGLDAVVRRAARDRAGQECCILGLRQEAERVRPLVLEPHPCQLSCQAVCISLHDGLWGHR